MVCKAKDNLDLLRLLSKAKPKQQKEFIKATNAEQVLALCECADNTLRGNVNLNPSQKKRLAKHKSVLRHLANTKISWKTKQKKLVQKGSGFLSILLPAIIALLSS